MSIAVAVTERRAVQSARTVEPPACTTALPAQPAAARSHSTWPPRVRITSELIDAYKREAHRLRAQAIKQAAESIFAGLARLWRA